MLENSLSPDADGSIFDGWKSSAGAGKEFCEKYRGNTLPFSIEACADRYEQAVRKPAGEIVPWAGKSEYPRTAENRMNLRRRNTGTCRSGTGGGSDCDLSFLQ